MARTEYQDSEAEKAYQDVIGQSSKPSADIGVRPEASFGGRSIVEVNNPNLGPSNNELEDRKRALEEKRKSDRGR